jgi:hypothetical protein
VGSWQQVNRLYGLRSCKRRQRSMVRTRGGCGLTLLSLQLIQLSENLSKEAGLLIIGVPLTFKLALQAFILLAPEGPDLVGLPAGGIEESEVTCGMGLMGAGVPTLGVGAFRTLPPLPTSFQDPSWTGSLISTPGNLGCAAAAALR